MSENGQLQLSVPRETLKDLLRELLPEVLGEIGQGGDEWLTVKEACKVTKLGEWHIRQKAKELLAQGSPLVYQPNPGRPPLRIRRAALLDLKAS